MKLIEVAREQRDLLNEGIAFIAIWREKQKNGRFSWFSEDIFPDGGVENDMPIFDGEQSARLAEIAAVDADAVLLNGYIDSWIGSADEPLSAADIAVGLRAHYDGHDELIRDYLDEGEADEPEVVDEPAAEPEAADEPVDEPKATEGDAAPETVTIEIPAADIKPEILGGLLHSKASLIIAALGDDYAFKDRPSGLGDIPIYFTGDTIKFPWLKFGVGSEGIEAWSAFITAAANFSRGGKRVLARDAPIGDNPRFAFRVFLVKIGLKGADSRCHRRYLLRNLKGDAAFATVESKERWAEKRKRYLEVIE